MDRTKRSPALRPGKEPTHLRTIKDKYTGLIKVFGKIQKVFSLIISLMTSTLLIQFSTQGKKKTSRDLSHFDSATKLSDPGACFLIFKDMA